MWPIRTRPYRRKVARMRAAQTAGRACVMCGTKTPRGARVAFANGIRGVACLVPCRRTSLELTR